MWLLQYVKTSRHLEGYGEIQFPHCPCDSRKDGHVIAIVERTCFKLRACKNDGTPEVRFTWCLSRSTGQNTWDRPDPHMDEGVMALVILRIAIVERVDIIKIFTKLVQFFYIHESFVSFYNQPDSHMLDWVLYSQTAIFSSCKHNKVFIKTCA